MQMREAGLGMKRGKARAAGSRLPESERSSMTAEDNKLHCNFDATTAKAVRGKNVVAMITDKTGAKLLGISGQQGLAFSMETETTEVSTKDGENDGWKSETPGVKSWSASADGLSCFDDEGQKMVAKALAEDDYLCFRICERSKSGNTTTYKPIRIGLVLVTSYSLDAPNDDNVTYSMDFSGIGKPWLVETAAEGEVEAATYTVTEGA
mgnify:CR=1 FL=1